MDEYLLPLGFLCDKWLYDKESGKKVVCVQYVDHERKMIINHSISFSDKEAFDSDNKVQNTLGDYCVERVVFQAHEDDNKKDFLEYLHLLIKE